MSAREREAAFLEGESTLGAAIAIGPSTYEGLRSQARALFDAGLLERARDVLLGISALGEVHPADLVLLAAAYRGLGEPATADQLEATASALIAALDEGIGA
jgi:hypothetical protein